MKPLRVFAENYALYESVNWEIPEGVTAILGRNEAGEGISSNGAGKTRLLEILPLALWGPGSWADYLSAGSDGVCVVGCEFEHAGSVYRVRRTYNPSGRGKTTLDFEELQRYTDIIGPEGGPTVESWVPLTRDNQAATQTAIRDLLGIGEATFHHSVFAAQGARHFADAELTPKERGEILADGLGLDLWDSFREVVAADRLLLEREESVLQSQLGAWADQLATHEDVVAAALIAKADVEILERALSEAREKHAALDNTYRTAREALATRTAAEREADALLSTVRELERQKTEADAAAVELAELVVALSDANERAAGVAVFEAEVERLRALDAAWKTADDERQRLLLQEKADLEAHRLWASSIAGLEQQRQERLDKIDKLMRDENGECDRCGQPVSGGSLAAFTESMDGEARDLAIRIGEVKEDAKRLLGTAAETKRALLAVIEATPERPDPSTIEAAETNLANARIAETEAARLAGRVESLSKAVEAASGPTHQERLTRAREAHTEATGRLVGLPADVTKEQAAKMALDALGAEVEAARIDAELAEARTAHGTATERARALAEIAAQNEQAVAQQKTLRYDLDVLRELEKAYGRAGIPVLLLESLYVPQIEREANLVLERWGVPYTVELVTQKQQKTTDRLRDTMEVVVHSPNGPRRYQTFSGGERDRVNVALRVALARVIGSHRGHSLEVFALDELAHLDAAGVEKLAQLLTELQREIPVVLFISHAADLSDAFDQKVTVIREGGRSRLEVAA